MFISAIPQNYNESKNSEKYSLLENHAMSLLNFKKPDLYDENYLLLVSLIAEGAHQTMHPNVAYLVYNNFLSVLQENDKRTDWKFYQLYYNLCRKMIHITTYIEKHEQTRWLLDKINQILDVLFSNEEIARDFWKVDDNASELNKYLTAYAKAENKLSEALHYYAMDDVEINETILEYPSGETKKLDTTKYEHLLLTSLYDFISLQDAIDTLSDDIISDSIRESMKTNINSQKSLIMLMLNNNDSVINILSSKDVSTTEDYLTLGLAHLDEALYDKSIDALELALERCKNGYGVNHTLNISIRIVLSLCYKFKGILANESVEKQLFFNTALQEIEKCETLIAKNVETKDANLIKEIYNELISLSNGIIL